MVSPIPEQLKKHDLGRFAQRAAQLDKLKPVVAYWCYYWILKQVISKGLEKTDAECAAYAGSLMDHVELIKTQHPSEDALNDDVAAQLYIEQFGLETFERGDKAIQGNHVSKQTADTLQAAATFLEIVNIWNSPSPELASKIKYAKFHALRIVKAIRAGEDPNRSNPPPPEPELDPSATDVPLDPNDPDVQAINRAAAHQPTVADAPDIDAPPSSLATHITAPPADDAVSPIGAGADAHPAPSTQSSTIPDTTPRANSVGGGGYFPEIPSAPSSQPLPPTGAPLPAKSPATEDYYAASPPAQPHLPPQQAPPPPAPVAAPVPVRPAQPASAPAPAPVAAPAIAPRAPPGGEPDDVAIAAAQKHARWAISALNFEDVPTALRELRSAIERLGGS